MSRRVERVPYHLDTKGIRSLPLGEDEGPDAMVEPLDRSVRKREEAPQA